MNSKRTWILYSNLTWKPSRDYVWVREFSKRLRSAIVTLTSVTWSPVPTRNSSVLETQDSSVSLVMHLNNRNNNFIVMHHYLVPRLFLWEKTWEQEVRVASQHSCWVRWGLVVQSVKSGVAYFTYFRIEEYLWGRCIGERLDGFWKYFCRVSDSKRDFSGFPDLAIAADCGFIYFLGPDCGLCVLLKYFCPDFELRAKF